MNYSIIGSKAELDKFCSEIISEKLIALDTETSLGGSPPKLSLVQISTRTQNVIIDALAIDDISALKPVLESRKIIKVIHYAAFERSVLKPFGIDIENVYDTCTESRKIRSNLQGHSLKAVCERELNVQLDKSFQSSDWMVRPLSEEQLYYAAMDSYVLIKLYDIFSAIKTAPPPF